MKIELGSVSRRFSRSGPPAVDDLSLTIASGEILALAGASGSGKTTTLRMIAGFERPDDGQIVCDGRVVATPRRAIRPERRGVGVVFQDYALFPHLTVARNVAFGLRGDAGDNERRVAYLLDLAGIPELGARYPHEISGGQQQRVALVRALAPHPRAIVLDEPFSNLDHTCTHRLLAETRGLIREMGCTAIVVSHDRYEAFTLADRVAFLHDGRLVQEGRPEELYAAPRTQEVADFAGTASYLPVTRDDRRRWTSPLGPVPGAIAVIDGPSPVAVVRPHDVTLHHEPSPSDAPSSSGRIVDVRDLGAVRSIHVHVGGTEVIVQESARPDATRPPGPPTVGAVVRVAWAS